jgi:hypothetical protein
MDKQKQRGTNKLGSIYQITIEGIVDDRWSDWFHGMEICPYKDSEGNVVTTFSGLVADQAALRGLLVKLWDLNTIIIAVKKIGPLKEGC